VHRCGHSGNDGRGDGLGHHSCRRRLGHGLWCEGRRSSHLHLHSRGLHSRLGDRLGDRLDNRLGDRLGNRLGYRLGNRLGDRLGNRLGGAKQVCFDHRLCGRLGRHINHHKRPRLPDCLRSELRSSRGGDSSGGVIGGCGALGGSSGISQLGRQLGSESST
jgi:hypothetical protein